MNLFSYGYSAGGNLDDLRRYVEQGALIIDTRLHPFSWYRHEFRKHNLKRELGHSYQWWGDYFGNLNHKNGLPIALKCPNVGVRLLRETLFENVERRVVPLPESLILLCTCPAVKVQQCHRTTVATLLMEAGMFSSMRHLKPGEGLDG